ncbi:hypothetical protein BECAL_01202 [Bellilinea caldifistulae]|uniref:hypothetical protein n=1 Tax=Bellilinea caldifistulae TaxID=360411 RepID=UPI0012F85D19|nr:hypothetical protein [Bellilinea caldifistulae]GAP10046.1 hypothetical protein BECAL_01202 [Bellilinea caldifistulae]GIV65555.1 MAG: hypothetical protein KatS3mg046_815 [Bellilinea sp.]
MEQPANTLSYFIAGYGVIFGVMIVYLASLIIRWRNLKQDEALLNELDQKEGGSKE